jgi:hypothetical protein
VVFRIDHGYLGCIEDIPMNTYEVKLYTGIRFELYCDSTDIDILLDLIGLDLVDYCEAL